MPLWILLILLVVVGTFAYAAVRGAPWVPTWKKDVGRVLKLAQLKPGERFYDLGCGDGRLVRAAARAGARATGFEISLLPFVIARIIQTFFHLVPEHSIRYTDFWNADLSDADVVYCFLMKKHYQRLRAKLERELRPGSRVILYVWPIDGWTPDTIDQCPGTPSLFLYTIRSTVLA